MYPIGGAGTAPRGMSNVEYIWNAKQFNQHDRRGHKAKRNRAWVLFSNSVYSPHLGYKLMSTKPLVPPRPGCAPLRYICKFEDDQYRTWIHILPFTAVFGLFHYIFITIEINYSQFTRGRVPSYIWEWNEDRSSHEPSRLRKGWRPLLLQRLK